jgi:copper chaperone CopZ
MHETTYAVDGMTCQHCANAVTEELSAIADVQRVDVDVPSGRVIVASDAPIAVDTVRDAIAEAGYRLAGGAGS